MEKIWPYKLESETAVSTEIGDISVNGDGILIIRYKNDLNFTLNKVKSAVRICEDIANNKKMLTMVVTGEHGYMPSETREYLTGKEIAKHRKAVALVINNLPHRIIATFIAKIRRNYYPTEVFKNEQDALLWLKNYEI